MWYDTNKNLSQANAGWGEHTSGEVGGMSGDVVTVLDLQTLEMVPPQVLHTVSFRWNRRLPQGGARNEIAIMHSLMVSSDNEFGEVLCLEWVLRQYN